MKKNHIIIFVIIGALFLYLILITATCVHRAGEKAGNALGKIQKLQDGITIEPPTESMTKVVYDSTWLMINILKDGYAVFLLNDSLKTNNPDKVDHFIGARKDKIFYDKILVKGSADAPYESFKPIKIILKKYEFYRFKMVTNGE